MTLSHTPRRSLLAAWLLACVLPLSAGAQDAFPSKPIRIINNFPAGGPSDLLSRSLAEVLQARFRQPVLVENRTGAAGNIGADAVAKAPADGHTVLLTIDSTLTVNPHVYPSMPFQPADLKPLSILASSGLLLGVNPGIGVKSMAELVSLGRTRSLNFSTAGSGSPGHVAAAMLIETTGMQVNVIPYRGNAQAVPAIMAGEVDAGILATPGMLPHVQSGRIRALGVTSKRRSPLAPDLPTLAEQGFPKLEFEVLYVALVPAATPAAVAQQLQTAFTEALQRPEVQQRLNQLDLHLESVTGYAAAQRLRAVSTRYQRVVETTKMQVQ